MTIKPRVVSKGKDKEWGYLNLYISHGMSAWRLRSLGLKCKASWIKNDRLKVNPDTEMLVEMYDQHEGALKEIYRDLLKEKRHPRHIPLADILGNYDSWRDYGKVVDRSSFLLDYFGEFYELRKIRLKKSTSLNKVKDTWNDLRYFEDKVKGRKLLLRDVNAHLVQEFVGCLFAGENYSGKRNSNNTVVKKLFNLQMFCEFLHKKGLIEDVTFSAVVVSSVETQDFSLTFDEIDQLYKTKGDNMMRRVIDAYVFCCDTGLRQSDLNKARSRNIFSVNTKGKSVMVMKVTEGTDKTAARPVIILTKRASEIMERYNGCVPLHSHQVLNRQIKRAAKAAGLRGTCEVRQTYGEEVIVDIEPRWKVIKFHSSRASYITNMLSSGVSIASTGKSAGQKRASTTQRYFRPGNEQHIAEFIAKVGDKIEFATE